MFSKILIFLASLVGLLILLPIAIYSIVVLLPEAMKIEKLANESKIQVRVVDRDTNQPIEDAVVRIEARYYSYCPGFMQNYRLNERGYWLTTDKNGIASIPMKYFLIKGMRYSSRLLCFFSDVRVADLPSSAIIIADHDDYASDRKEFGPGAVKFIEFTDGEMLPEFRLRQRAKVNTKRGRFNHSDRNQADGLEPSARTELYFKIHVKDKFLARAATKEEADFAVIYEKIKAEDYDCDRQHDLKTFTDNDNIYKLLSSIEGYGRGGVAHDPNAPYIPEQLSDASKLNYQSSLSLKKQDGSRDHRLVVVRSRDGERYIALNIHPFEIWWVYPKGESVFWHTSGNPGPFYKNSFVSDFREFDPATSPDFKHWKD